MKNIICFFILLIMPVVAISEPLQYPLVLQMTDDVEDTMRSVVSGEIVKEYKPLEDGCIENGKYKNEYTIDRRCYLTDEQKKQFPYNTVVRVSGEVYIYGWQPVDSCTGVIVKDVNDGQLYVYTAGHCDKWYTNIFATTQDGRKIDVKKVVKKNKTGVLDIAVYAIPKKEQQGLPYATIGKMTEKNLDVVGYGALPVLSDKAIRAARKAWVKFLTDAQPNSVQATAIKRIEKAGGFMTVLVPHENVIQLKASFDCNLGPQGTKVAKQCQAYYGNSGGPYFNSNGQVVAVARQSDMSVYANLWSGQEQQIAPVKDLKKKK